MSDYRRVYFLKYLQSAVAWNLVSQVIGRFLRDNFAKRGKCLSNPQIIFIHMCIYISIIRSWLFCLVSDLGPHTLPLVSLFSPVVCFISFVSFLGVFCVGLPSKFLMPMAPTTRRGAPVKQGLVEQYLQVTLGWEENWSRKSGLYYLVYWGLW